MSAQEPGYPVFSRDDTNLYAAWHHESGGIVSVYIPGQRGFAMTLAKAEEFGASILRQAEYGRRAAGDE